MNFIYGYWFKSKKRTFGYGWTILPTTWPGYLTYGLFVIAGICAYVPEYIDTNRISEIQIVSLSLMAMAALVTFLKTNFKDS